MILPLLHTSALSAKASTFTNATLMPDRLRGALVVTYRDERPAETSAHEHDEERDQSTSVHPRVT